MIPCGNHCELLAVMRAKWLVPLCCESKIRRRTCNAPNARRVLISEDLLLFSRSTREGYLTRLTPSENLQEYLRERD